MKLRLLCVLNVSFIDFQLTHFNDVAIRIVVTSNYYLCCFISKKCVCLAQTEWYLQCSHIFTSKSVIIAFILVSTLIVVLNAKSIVLHITMMKTKHKAFLTLVVSLNISNFLLAGYFSFLWIANLFFQKTFVAGEQMLKSQPVCFIAFGILLCFTILNQLLLLLMSLSRLMIVIYPLQTQFKHPHFIQKSLFCIFLISFFITMSLDMFLLFTETKIGNNLCLPFVDQTNSILLIKIITWFVIITQTIISVTIMIMHVSIYIQKKKSDINIRKSKSDANSSDITLIIQLFVVTLSNFICWFPTNIIYILAMFLSSYSFDLVVWTTVIVMPFNSFVIPGMLIIASLKNYFRVL